MELRQHKIQENRFEISFYGKEKTSRIFQSRFSVILKSRLVSLIDKVLDEFSSEGAFIRINQLELDLGSINLQNFEAYIEPRLKEELRRELRKAKYEIEAKPAIHKASFSRTEHRLELLFYYLEHGTLPWWAHRDKGFSVEELFLKLLKNDKTNLLHILRKKGHSSRLRQRIVKQFEETTLLSLVSELAPSEGAFIEAYIEDIKQRHKNNPITKTTAQGLTESLWEVILSYLLQDRGTRFNRKEFLRWNLTKLAAGHNIAYRELLERLNQSLDMVEENRHFYGEIRLLIKEIAGEDIPESSPEEKKPDRWEIAHFIHFLETGVFKASTKFSSFHHLWSFLFANEREAVARVMLIFGRKEEARELLVEEFSMTELSELIIALEPSHAGLIISFADTAVLINRDKKLKTGDEANFRKSVWIFILRFLVDKGETRFNKKEFIRANLHSIAVLYRVRFGEVLNYFRELIHKTEDTLPASDSLPELVLELYRENLQEHEQSPAEYAGSGLLARYEDFIELEQYIICGLSLLSLSARRSLYKDLFEQPPFTVIAFLNKVLVSREAVFRISKDMTQKLFRSFLELMIPDDFQPVNRFWEQLKVLVHTGKKLSLTEQRVYFEAVISSFLTGGKLTGESVLTAMLKVARVHFSVEKEALQILIKNTKGWVSKEIQAIPLGTGSLSLMSTKPPAKSSDISRIVETLSSEAVVRVLFFYATGRRKKGTVFIQGKKISFEKMMVLVFKHHFSTARRFFEGLDDRLVRISGKHLAAFYDKSLSLVKEKSGQLAHASRLQQIIAEKAGRHYRENGQNRPGKEEKISLKQVFWYLEGEESGIFSETVFLEALNYFYQHKKEAIGEYLLYHSQFEKPVRSWISRFSEQALLRMLQGIDSYKLGQKIRLVDTVMDIWLHKVNSTYGIKRLSVMKWSILFSFTMHRVRKGGPFYFLRHVLDELCKEAGDTTTAGLDKKLEILVQLTNSRYLESDKELLQAGKELLKELKRAQKEAARLEQENIKKDEPGPVIGDEEEISYREEEQVGGEVSQYFINNAGMVLLGVFLPTYYARLDLLNGKEFKNQESVYKAIHLLQYLVTGEVENYEYDLVLNKVLCGISISEPIPHAVELTQKEISLSEDLIKASIERWAVIGDTSVAGFRESFLKREGKLEALDDVWKLTVEVKGYDMLLDQLPWSISMIMHPWMEKRIQIEWR